MNNKPIRLSYAGETQALVNQISLLAGQKHYYFSRWSTNTGAATRTTFYAIHKAERAKSYGAQMGKVLTLRLVGTEGRGSNSQAYIKLTKLYRQLEELPILAIDT